MKIKKSLLYSVNPITNYLPKIHKKDFNGILFLISNIDSRFFEHKYDSTCLSLSQEMRYSLFGQNRWRIIYNDKSHLFHKLFKQQITGNSYQKITNGYKVTKYLISIYHKFLQSNEDYPCEYISLDDKIVICQH